MEQALQPLSEEWDRLLAIVAHPDDLEYGAASAVARWTASGKHVGYVIVTDGEAGIDGLHPEQAGPVRVEEQRESAAIVGVEEVAFLGYADGVVEYGLELRRDLAREIRRHRPDVILIVTHELTYGPAAELHLNQADHRAVGLATLDAARDAGNRWIFPELDIEPWTGVSEVLVMGSTTPTHGVDVTDTIETGIASLQAHRTYIEGLGRDFDAAEFLRGMTAGSGQALGTTHAVALGRIQIQGV